MFNSYDQCRSNLKILDFSIKNIKPEKEGSGNDQRMKK